MRVFLATSFLFLISLCSAARQELRNSQETCFTPWRTHGTCVPLTKCNHLLHSLMLENEKPNPSFDFLPKFYCGADGNTPKYCCENKVTEDVGDYQQSPTEINSYEPSSNPPNVAYHNNRKLLNEDICGTRNGRKDKIFQYPWMAILVYGNKYTSQTEYRCGGSIINNRYILTAAHCVTEHPKNDTLVGVRVGVQNWSSLNHCVREENEVDEFCADYQDIYIERIEHHPQFSSGSLKNDVALLRLEKNIDFSQGNARPICLPIGSAANLTKTQVVITGWGITQNGAQNTELLDTFFSLVSNKKCETFLEKYREIRKTQICAVGDDEKKCTIGDDGGPLQSLAYYNGNYRYVQYGIKNFGLHTFCTADTYPNIYTRVDYYLNWILDTIRE